LEGNVDSNKDKWMDLVGAVIMTAAFILLWCGGAMLDLALVGM
jgi:hypothetical protein